MFRSIRGALLDQRQEGLELRVGCIFGLHRKARHHREPGTPDELRLLLVPQRGFSKGKRRIAEEVVSGMVADVPRVQAAGP